MDVHEQTDAGIVSILLRGGIAFALGLAANFLILWLVFTFDLTGSTADLEYWATTIVTAVGVAGATLTYGLLSWRFSRPDRLFARVAVVALALSFLPNLGLILSAGGPATDEVLVLMVMHFPPALACVGSLTGRLSRVQRSG